MNSRKTVLATLLAALAVTPFAITPLRAQPQVQSQVQHVYTQAELDQMLAPIALYPDSLLSQVLMAATYPIEVGEAARWARANPGLQGDGAVRAVQEEDWDPSVKSLVAFPEVLQRMDEKIDWTRSLGDAFLAQEPQMMDQVQQLRQRAQANGNLRSNEQFRVEQQGPVIVVRPARPEYVYVPYYDPLEVYGTWWWPSYRPVAWDPWPGYARPYYRPGISASFWWGRPVGLSLGFFFGDFDWGRRHVRIAHANSYYYRQPRYENRSYAGDRGRWYHDSFHRRGADYRNAAVRQRFSNEAFVLGQQPSARRGDGQAQREQRRAPGFGAQTQQSNTLGQQPAGADRQALREQRRAERNARQSPQTQPQAPRSFTAPRQAQPQPQMQQAPQSNNLFGRIERQAQQPQQAQPQPRVERRTERREERQAQPQPQPQPQPRFERRFERREERQAQPQSQARPQPQARQERQERASMPAAQAPQTPRSEARGVLSILGR